MASIQSEPSSRQAAMLPTKQCFPKWNWLYPFGRNLITKIVESFHEQASSCFYHHHHYHYHHHYHHHHHHHCRTRIGVGAVQSQVRSVHIELQPWRRQQVL
ncbi:hypothetical protein V1477_002430, partial [Vespula maculifrons]